MGFRGCQSKKECVSVYCRLKGYMPAAATPLAFALKMALLAF